MIASRLLAHAPVHVAQAAAGFLAIAAFSRLMTPEQYGLYALVLSAAMAGHTLTFTWAEAAAFRFFSRSTAPHAKAVHLSSLLIVAAVAGVAAGVVGLAFGAVVGWDNALGLAGVAAIASAYFRFLTRLARETDRAGHAAGRFAARETLYTVLALALGVALAAGASLGAAAPFVGALAAGVLLAAWDLPDLMLRAKRAKPSARRLGAYLRYGAPLALALSLELFVQAGARMTLAAVSGLEAVAAFAIAFGLVRILDVAFVWTGLAAGPILMSAYEEHGREAAAAVGRDYARLLLALTAPAALGIALVAEPLAQAVVGADLASAAAPLIPWLAGAGFAAGWLTYFFSEPFQLTRKTGLRAAWMTIPAVLTLALVAIGASAAGALGAAVGVCAAAAVGALTLAVAGRRLVRLPVPLYAVAQTGMALAAMTAAVLAIPPVGGWVELLAKALAGAAAYGVAAVALDLCGARTTAQAWLRARLRLGEAAL